MKKGHKLLVTTILLLSIILLFNTRFGNIPPLGKFFNPFTGIWQNALISDIPKGETIHLQGLRDEVNVVFNQRGVPHIFANNEHDLYFITGYVTAMHRLWQMEFGTHASLGRLAEVVGERALEFDRYIRRMGMAYGAERYLASAMECDTTMLALNAYSAGVNAWISRLTPKNLPFEYKLLNYTPEPWTPLKTLSLGMSINRTLTFYSQALRMSYMKALWGEEAILALYADLPQDIIPVVKNTKQYDLSMIPQPADEEFIPSFIFDDLMDEPVEGVGSNNWVVMGKKTRSGAPLFACDPHLSVTLPSIWYELQLNAPGINAYGITFPGVPNIVMGFNEHIAWGNTNAGNKVVDIFEVETDDDFRHYLHGKEWKPLEFRVETYKTREGGRFTDTIAFTHHGPLMYRARETAVGSMIPAGHAISWTALQSRQPINALKQVNTATDLTQWRRALSALEAPPQSYAFASRSGDIAIQYNGLWPLKWEHQGMFILDGRNPHHDWQGKIPFEKLPYEINPPRGFVASANQHPADEDYPFYHGWLFASTSRATIIEQQLEELKDATLQDMMNLQLNADNHWAAKYMKPMIDSVVSFLKQNQHTPEASDLLAAIDSLLLWDKVNTYNSAEATIFEKWREAMRTELWKPLTMPAEKFRPVLPSHDVTLQVLFHQSPVETYYTLFDTMPYTGKILTETLAATLQQLEKENGPWGENWHWWRFNGTTINHLLNIPALNHPRLKVSGSAHSPNAIRNSHAPSWRMVAELDDTLKAWGIYPGGQAANPATMGYKASVADWAQGNYYELKLYNSYLEMQNGESNTTTLTFMPAMKAGE